MDDTVSSEYGLGLWSVSERQFTTAPNKDVFMPPISPTLCFLCVKITSGKSTLTAKLGDLDGAIVIAEDEWLKERARGTRRSGLI
jgi:hypothetical protein